MKVKLNIPTELSEIKLKDYIRFMNVVKGSNDSEFINQKMVECFCNIDLTTPFGNPLAFISGLLSKKHSLRVYCP